MNSVILMELEPKADGEFRKKNQTHMISVLVLVSERAGEGELAPVQRTNPSEEAGQVPPRC